MRQKKIRVAMICHFSNANVRAHLPLDNRKLATFLRKILGLPEKKAGYGDIAPWDTASIAALSLRPDIDLHVISAHSGLKKSIVSFEDNNVHYNFVRCDEATMLKHVIKSDRLWLQINPMKHRVCNLVNKIDPDIVVLFGTENAYYSGTVLGIHGYPVYVLQQTVYNNPERKKNNMWSTKNAYTEMQIFNKEHYYGVYCKMHYDLLRQYCPDSFIFKFRFPANGFTLNPTPTEKVFDFVNFALTLDLRKGAHDSIRAIARIKQKYPKVTLNLVGGCNDVQKKELEGLIKELGVEDNVIFTPFFEKRSDLFLHIQKSKYAVLPCKLDHTSGTMSQAMQLGLPIVVYKTSGTPAFNREKECALIAEHSNVEDLATKMLILMEDSNRAELLRKNAKEFQEKRAEYNRHNGERLIANFYAIIDNYQNGTPIPEEQLFNSEQDD